MVTIVLVQPQQPENIGFVARSMKNFGYSKLIIIDPQCDPHHDQALRTAMHAKEILLDVVIVTTLQDIRSHYDRLIATTAIIGKDTNLVRTPISISQLHHNLTSNTAIVFGTESQGLSNEHLSLCDLTFSIPTSEIYPTMNLSHAVAVVLYELSKTNTSRMKQFVPATRDDLDRIASMFVQVLTSMDFATEDKRTTQQLAWNNIMSKSQLTKREAMVVYGFLRKLTDFYTLK